MMFALRFPDNKTAGWRRPLDRIAVLLAILLPAAWLYLFIRFEFLGVPSQWIFRALVIATSVVYVAAAVIFLVTLFRSHGEARQRQQWILVFPAVLLLRVAVINFPRYMPDWMPDALIALGVLVPLTVAYAVIRRRVFDVQFVISRALVYASLTTIVAGTFLLLDWFMSKQFAQTRFTLTAEIIFALALGSSLNALHHNVDRFVDAVFFRQRHLAERRLAKAAAAITRAESFAVVDQFLVHEPVHALGLVSAALFRKNEDGRFVRTLDLGWDHAGVRELSPSDPLVLHSWPRAHRCVWRRWFGPMTPRRIWRMPFSRCRCCFAIKSSQSRSTVHTVPAPTSTLTRRKVSRRFSSVPVRPTITSMLKRSGRRSSC